MRKKDDGDDDGNDDGTTTMMMIMTNAACQNTDNIMIMKVKRQKHRLPFFHLAACTDRLANNLLLITRYQSNIELLLINKKCTATIDSSGFLEMIISNSGDWENQNIDGIKQKVARELKGRKACPSPE